MWHKEIICLTPEEAEPVRKVVFLFREMDEDEPRGLYSHLTQPACIDRTEWPHRTWHEWDAEHLLSARYWLGLALQRLGVNDPPGLVSEERAAKRILMNDAVRFIDRLGLKTRTNRQVESLRAYLSPPISGFDPAVRDWMAQAWDPEIAYSYRMRLDSVFRWWRENLVSDDFFSDTQACRKTEAVTEEVWGNFIHLLRSVGATFRTQTKAEISTYPTLICNSLPGIEVYLFHPGNDALVRWADNRGTQNHRTHPALALALFLLPAYAIEHPVDTERTEQDGVARAGCGPKVFGCDPKWWWD